VIRPAIRLHPRGRFDRPPVERRDHLADVLAVIVDRVRDQTGTGPSVISYDPYERTWNPPMPLLFQRRLRAENRPITAQAIRQLLDIALDRSGLTEVSRSPLLLRTDEVLSPERYAACHDVALLIPTPKPTKI